MGIRDAGLSLLMLVVGAGVALGQEKDQSAKKDRNVITFQELEKSGARSAMHAIRKLRPFWLSSRGATTLRTDANGAAAAVTRDEAMGVYVDGVRRGGTSELDLIAIEQVDAIRFYSAEAAVTKFGSGNPLGAVEVVMKK